MSGQSILARVHLACLIFKREEFDPEDAEVNVIAAKDVVLDSDDLGPASGECGCMAGPKYPSIDTCDY